MTTKYTRTGENSIEENISNPNLNKAPHLWEPKDLLDSLCDTALYAPNVFYIKGENKLVLKWHNIIIAMD